MLAVPPTHVKVPPTMDAVPPPILPVALSETSALGEGVEPSIGEGVDPPPGLPLAE
jgi:hypothetical protein